MPVTCELGMNGLQTYINSSTDFKSKFIKFAFMSNSLLSPTFCFTSTEDESSALQEKKLCVEYGHYHLSFIISNRTGDTCYHVAFYQFKNRPEVRTLSTILSGNEVYRQSFTDVVLVHNQKEMVLVPSFLYKQELEQTLLETIHGDTDSMIIMNDDVHQWELNNVYGCNRFILDAMKNAFPHTRNTHFTTLALRSIFRNIRDDKGFWMKIFFYPSSLQVYALKGDQLLLAQSFYYETKEDVIFHLLNLADKFNIDLTEAFVEISGLIDDESGTWKELNRYILNIQLENPVQQQALNVNDPLLPPHFLTPFFLIAKCV
ncbi:MAG: hypothetical protein RLZZ42_52 [Bacteroidota bacterium]